jgi:hypothetical protein
MVREILNEQLEEISTMGGNVGSASGNVEGYAGGSSPDKKKDDEDDEDEVNEVAYTRSELPPKRSGSYMTVRVTSYGRHKSDGNVSDVGYKKSVKNKFKIDSTYTDKRAPYYSEGDIITDLVEKVLRNIIRSN